MNGRTAEVKKGINISFPWSTQQRGTSGSFLYEVRWQEAVATALYEEVIVRTSVPTTILSDRGGEFTGEVVQRVCERLGITVYTPEDVWLQTADRC